ncbi:MAG: hypothetical protein LLG02_13415 [Pelosinus sp.]|nr:hypothetical protein [Pelosinus sp.]
MSHKKLTQLSLVACIAVSSGAAYAAEPGAVSVDLNYWHPAVNNSSEMRMPTSSTIKLKDDLGHDKNSSLSLTVNYKKGNQIWYIGGDGIDSKESKTLTKSFKFNNTSYAAGDKTSSELTVRHNQIGVRTVHENSAFYTNYQLNNSSVKTTITNNTTGAAACRDKDVTSLGIGFGWETRNPDKLNFFAEVTPLSLFGSGTYNDCKLGIKTSLGEKMNFTLGYKVENFRTGNDNDADRTVINLRGLYFCLGGKF